MRLFKIIGIILIFVSTASYADNTNTKDAVYWQNLAKTDLTAMQQILLQNAADALDPDAVWFHQWIWQGYDESLSKLPQVNSEAGYYYLMHFYQNGFQNMHIQFNLKGGSQPPETWPGFTVYYSGGNFYVKRFDDNPNLPPADSQLVSCDGTPANQLMLHNVLPYFGRARIPGTWQSNAHSLLVYQGNPWWKPYQQCTFLVKAKPMTYSLTWENVPPEVALSYNNKADFTLEPFGKDSVWVTLPTFDPNSQQKAELQAILDKMPQYRNAKYIVFDIRGNNGGSDHWGNAIYNQLFGDNYFNEKMQQAPGAGKFYASIRVSKLNYDWFLQNSGDYEGDINHFQQDLAQNIPYYNTPIDAPIPFKKVRNPVHAKIFVLMEGHCGSACLDFIDTAVNFPNSILIGQPTDADVIYMELNIVALPSGNELGYPIKIDHRYRKSMQYYEPCYTYQGDIADTNKVKAWIKQIAPTAKSCGANLSHNVATQEFYVRD